MTGPTLITNISVPIANKDAASKSYVDTVAAGMNFLDSVDSPDIYDIDVEHLGGTEYRIVAKTSDGVIRIKYPKYQDKPKDLSIDEWIDTMDKVDVMVGAKIYYDIWTFDDDSEINKTLFTAFDRKIKTWSPPSGPTAVVEGSVRYRTDNNTLEVFVGGKWLVMSTT